MLDTKLQDDLIQKGRDFMKYYDEDEWGEFESDQDLNKPQPPLTKAPMRSTAIPLPGCFGELAMHTDLTELFRCRKSSRVYTGKGISLLQLSYLLWASQGIKDIRGNAYATIRTVPSGGARHGFETYLAVRNVEGLRQGAYHYLPLTHELEYLHPIEDIEHTIGLSLCSQTWTAHADVVFYWSVVAYRCEWRYGIFAHRVALIDAGHMAQNLYLACAALGLGNCAIAAFDNPVCDGLFELDGQEEFIVYTCPVGTINEEDRSKEQAFYKFVEDKGL